MNTKVYEDPTASIFMVEKRDHSEKMEETGSPEALVPVY
jgi:hypothetical protein